MLGCLFLNQKIISAQDLNRHQWNDRLVLLFAPEAEHPFLQKQIKIFQKDQMGMKERKLLVYYITPHAVLMPGNQPGNANFAKALYKEYEVEKEAFTFILVGLDGGEKMRKQDDVSLKDLYAIIDRMPMRRQELNEKQ